MNEKKPSERLPKPCRLRHKALVDALFDGGDARYGYPLRVVWRKVSEEQMQSSFRPGFVPKVAKVQMMVSVPKRKQRHAVDRVLMRRRIREAYRRLLPAFEEEVRRHPDIATLSIGIIYISQKIESYGLISRRLSAILAKIAESL